MTLVLGLPDNAQSVHFNKNDEALAKKQPRLKNACKVAKAAAEELMQQKQAKSLHPRAAAVVSTVERMVTADTKSEIDCKVRDSNQHTYCLSLSHFFAMAAVCITCRDPIMLLSRYMQALKASAHAGTGAGGRQHGASGCPAYPPSRQVRRPRAATKQQQCTNLGIHGQ